MYSIYVTEDDLVQAQLVADTLAICGSIKTFSTAIELIDALKLKACDLIVLDIMLPGMSGLDAISEIRKVDGCASIPILLLSAITEKQYVVEGLARGALDYVSKPFEPRQFRARVESLLRLKLQADEIDALLRDRSRIGSVAVEDVATPIQAASELIEFLSQDDRLPSALAPFIDEVATCIAAAGDGVKSIKTVLSSGPVRLQKRAFPISTLVNSVNRILRPYLQVLEITPQAQGIPTTLNVLVDPPQLVHALANIGRILIRDLAAGDQLEWHIFEKLQQKIVTIMIIAQKSDPKQRNETKFVPNEGTQMIFRPGTSEVETIKFEMSTRVIAAHRSRPIFGTIGTSSAVEFVLAIER